MKNKILSIILAVLFVLTITPVNAFADSLEEILPEQLMAYLYNAGLWSKTSGASTYSASYYADENKWVIDLYTKNSPYHYATLTYHPGQQSMDVHLIKEGPFISNPSGYASDTNSYEDGTITFGEGYYNVETTVNTWEYQNGTPSAIVYKYFIY